MYKRLLALLIGFFISISPVWASAFGEVTQHPSYRNCFKACSAFITPAAATTDIMQITGSSSKTIRVLEVDVSFTASVTTGLPTPTYLVKRSSADTSGTTSTMTTVALSSGNTSPTASITAYTANPTTGTAVGNICAYQILATEGPVGAAGASENYLTPTCVVYKAGSFDQAVTLTSAAEALCLNFNGTIPSGTSPLMAEE